MHKLMAVICFVAIPGYVISWNDVRVAMWETDPISVVLMAFATIAIVWLFCRSGIKGLEE